VKQGALSRNKDTVERRKKSGWGREERDRRQKVINDWRYSYTYTNERD
jgi:hypothetical protein